jgi:hypothetical protein
MVQLKAQSWKKQPSIGVWAGVVSRVYGTDEATQKHQHQASYQSPLKDHVPLRHPSCLALFLELERYFFVC